MMAAAVDGVGVYRASPAVDEVFGDVEQARDTHDGAGPLVGPRKDRLPLATGGESRFAFGFERDDMVAGFGCEL